MIFTISDKPPRTEIDKSMINLSQPAIELFDSTAKQIAQELADPRILNKKYDKRKRETVYEVKRLSNANKSTQLRKFYDELLMWIERSSDLDSFAGNLPFIKMLNAKVAYARGREHVDDKFLLLMSACLEQISEPNMDGFIAMKNMKFLMESTLGFYKAVEK